MRTELREGRTSAPCPEGWRRLGQGWTTPSSRSEKLLDAGMRFGMAESERAGVIVPCLDMLNSKAGSAQLAWKLRDEEEIVAGDISLVHPGRTRKHCQLCGSYGDLDNKRLVLH